MNEWRESDWQAVSKPAFFGVLGAVILLAMFYAKEPLIQFRANRVTGRNARMQGAS